MEVQNDTKRLHLTAMAPLLQVFDMPASLHFYRDLLGFQVINSSGNTDDVDWVLLKLNGYELMLNTAYERHERPDEPAPVRTAGHTDLTLYFSCPDVDAAYDYFKQKGIQVKKPFLTKYGWKALNMSDPDGYCISFHWPEN
jgi:catechol 2,3-dioxygenase-like lactoylglutathione lyase family enzyme